MPKHYPRFDRVCIIEGCGRPGYCRGWCCSHYDRWRHHGDPLAGATSIGEAQNYYRDVVQGYSGYECLLWPYSCTKDGYATLRVGDKIKRVHRLLCEQEHGPAYTPKHEAAHSCGNGHKGCVAKRHVSWKTRQGNLADKVLHGRSGRGSKNTQAKLTEADVIEIRTLRGIVTMKALAERFGVSLGYISHLQKRTKWAWLEDPAVKGRTVVVERRRAL